MEIINDNIVPPLESHVLKSNGVDYRTIYCYNRKDNWVMKALNEYFCNVYPHKINNKVFSYQSGISIKQPLEELRVKYSPEKFYIKLDLKNYFTSINLEILQTLLQEIQMPEHLINSVFTNNYYDKEGQLHNKELGMIQGNPISAFVSNAYLKSFDDLFSSSDLLYIRYSDDILLEVPDNVKPRIHLKRISKELSKLGLTINPSKVQIIQPKSTFIFLGFDIYLGQAYPAENHYIHFKNLVKYKTRKLKKRTDLLPREKVFILLKYIYNKTIFSKMYDTSTTSLFYHLNENCDIKGLMQELDYYIVSSCQTLLTDKYNTNIALKKGYTKSYLETIGYLSFTDLLIKSDNKFRLYSNVAKHFYFMKEVENASKITRDLSEPNEFKYTELLEIIQEPDVAINPFKAIYKNNKEIFRYNIDKIILDISLDELELKASQLLEINRAHSLSHYANSRKALNGSLNIIRYIPPIIPRRLLGYYSNPQSNYIQLQNCIMFYSLLTNYFKLRNEGISLAMESEDILLLKTSKSELYYILLD